jgi:hypothetical protein
MIEVDAVANCVEQRKEERCTRSNLVELKNIKIHSSPFF